MTDGSTPLLLECGIPYKEIQRGLNYQVTAVKACIVSHEHLDHCKAAQDVMFSGVDIYASWGTFNALRLGGHRTNVVKSLKQFKIDTWTILPFNTQHDAAEPLGFLLANTAGDKLLFLTDSFYCKYRFCGLTHIMCECNFAIDILRANIEAGLVPVELKNRLIKSHFSLENVKEFLRANDLSRVQEIHLLHMSDGNSDEERFKREIQELTGKMVIVA